MVNQIFVGFILLLSTVQSFSQHKILVEQFTNASCPNCALYVPPLMQYIDENSEIFIPLAFHTNFPGNDSMYYENSNDNDGRIAFYNTSSVPKTIIDGIHYNGTTAHVLQQIDSIANYLQAKPDSFEINFDDFTLNNLIVSGNVNVLNKLSALSTNLRLFIVLVEKVVLKSDYIISPGSSAENKYSYVVRKMLPNYNGTELSEDTTIYSVNYLLNNFKDVNQLRLVVFVQDIISKEVYSTSLYDIFPLSINGLDKSDVLIFPNPARNILHIHINHNLLNNSVTIYDIQGKVMDNQELTNSANVYLNINNYPTGQYFVLINKGIVRKIIKY